ncbi:leucine-rich repeat domain-containing protein [Actinomadura craniellae]|uniref:Leucine-rich repeat domain-containing protein n=1 Tax=Actinomadura craniellae TaxID=2231787 RepID=A0A365GY79_9ACTN|nr:STM4015 family protein [Actinomadura craniellae]RAY10883.1 leucine-rich repeat domain-containing protein [Actinomadura craniellae]
MTIGKHLSEYGGLPVFDFAREEERPEAGAAAWRVATKFDGEHFDEVFARFLREVDTTRVTALLIGYWGASYDSGPADPVKSLVAAADQFPALRSLFLGEIVFREAEISWIEHSSGVTQLLEAFPLLERFEVRGGTHLDLDSFESTALRVLRIETGGLPSGVAWAVGRSDLPNLERLDLWLGVPDYGGDTTAADLAPILGGERLPALRHLALADAEIQDEIAAAVASAPVVARLETLDLSMGALTDAGAEALLSGQPLTHLKKLDLSHHYLTDAMMDRLRAALPGVDLDLSDGGDPDDDMPYVEVSE